MGHGLGELASWDILASVRSRSYIFIWHYLILNYNDGFIVPLISNHDVILRGSDGNIISKRSAM